MEKIKNIQLTMTERQASTIMDALDIYSRLGLGQIDKLEHTLRFKFGKHKVEYDADKIEKLLKEVKDTLFPELRSNYYCSHGIFSPETPEDSKISWDLIQVLRYPIAWHKNPNGGSTVDFGVPHKSSLIEELANVRINVE